MTEDNDAGKLDDEAIADDWAQALQEQTGGGVNNAFASGAPHFDGNTPATPAGNNDISMVLDIPVQLSVELGRTKVPIKYILQLAQGSIVELDALAGEPMDVLVNGYLIAQGEVVVVNEKFGIRLTDIVTPSERLRRLSRN
jgi:flagellar motor switch protein FliN/FliY